MVWFGSQPYYYLPPSLLVAWEKVDLLSVRLLCQVESVQFAGQQHTWRHQWYKWYVRWPVCMGLSILYRFPVLSATMSASTVRGGSSPVLFLPATKSASTVKEGRPLSVRLFVWGGERAVCWTAAHVACVRPPPEGYRRGRYHLQATPLPGPQAHRSGILVRGESSVCCRSGSEQGSALFASLCDEEQDPDPQGSALFASLWWGAGMRP
jgi:hypothetical protein